MQVLYGAEYLRKWAAFTPPEMLALWAAKFEAERIHPDAVHRLVETMSWEHPPTLPQVVDRLHEIEEQLRVELRQEQARLALPNDALLAKRDSPAVQKALDDMRRFIARRTIC